MEVINLNLIPNGTNPVVHCSQYDEGRDFRFNLFNGTSVLTLDGTETIECDVKKPDGNIVTVAVTNTSSNYIVVTTTLQMTACSGNSLGTIKISKGGDNLYTLNFVLFCERSPLENGIQSDSAIHNLETQVEDIVSEQYDSANVIFDNAPTSGHGIPYVVSSDGLLAYIPKNVSDLSDVTTTTPSSGEAFVYDGSKWTNGTPTLNLDDLNDVTITTPTNGEIVVYNDGVWENQANPASTQNFAPDYDDTQTYNTNDKVIYQGLLYICNDDNVTGTWDATKWDAFTVADISGDSIPMSPNDPDKVADRITALESGKADKSVVNNAFATIGDIKVSTLSAGNKSIGDIQTWAKSEGKGLFWGAVYLTSPFSGWGVYWVYNRIVADTYSEIIIIQNDHIVTSFTSTLNNTTPTWTTKSGSLS